MAGIRVTTSVKKIEVNDQGDYIILNFSDSSFLNRFFTMMDSVQKRSEDMQAKAREIAEKCGEDKEEATIQTMALYCQLCGDIAKDVDAFFGPDTCRKVFGDIVPGFDLFEDFFNQLMPYFEEYSKDRAAKLGKYDPARTGNV